MALYITNKNLLNEAVSKLPPAAIAVLPDNLDHIIDEIGLSFELTMNEIGEICELVRQIITKEQPPEGLEDRLKEKLDEDNQPKAPDIVGALSEKIFAKLLPALGIKVPIEFAIKVGVPKVEGLEIAPLAPAHPIPLKKMPSLASFVPPPPVKGSLLHQAYETRVNTAPPEYQGEALINSTTLVEPSHEGMSKNPLESLLQMLEGKVSPNNLSRQLEKLPESLRQALSSVDSAKKVVDIGRKYALHMDKLGELGAETGMVILGFTHPADFLSRLTRRLGFPEEKVRLIAQEINTEVFLKIREALKQVHGETETGIAPKSPNSYQGEALIKKPASIPIKPPSGLETSESDETLDRETILRDIENPTPNLRVELGVRNQEPRAEPKATDTSPSKFPPADAGQLGGQTTTPFTKEIPSKLTSLPKPVLSRTPLETKTTPEPAPTTRVEPTTIPTPTPAPNITAFTPNTSPSKLSSSDAGKLGGQAPPIKPQNIIDQKLSGATSSTKSESRYTSDPYREMPE